MPKYTATISEPRPLALAGGTTIQAEGFAGALAVTQWTQPTGQRLRSAKSPADEDSSPQFRAALQELGIYEQETIHVDAPPTARLRGFGLFAAQPDRVLIRPAPPAEPGAAQVILYQDESGGLSWHFADGAPAPGARLRDTAGGATFTIPTRTDAAQRTLRANRIGPRMRGPITKWGRKIFKVLVLPALDVIAGPAVEAIVGAIERKHRQELIRGLAVENYRTQVRTPFTDWSALAGRRSLLVVHGIFSTTEGMLSQLPEPVMHELATHYSGRMVAFDQQTVSRSPEDNARFFLETLQREAPGRKFEFDILCHSRGGIVARTLAERGVELVPDLACDFRKVFFVATPNKGSVLGDPAHMVDMIDVFTNLLTAFPDGPVTYSIEVILAIVKLIAFSAERRLPGLAAMGTDDYIARVLNRATVRSPADYAAAASEYEPDPAASNGFLAGRFGDAVIDRIFKNQNDAVENDLVVPTEGVFGANGHPSFPIRETTLFGKSDHVWHTGFFAQSRTWASIRRHFEVQGVPTEILAHPNFSLVDYVRFSADAGATPSFWPNPSFETIQGNSLDGDASSSVRRLRFRESSAPPSHRSEVKATIPPTPEPVAAGPAELRRDPHIDFHEWVKEGEMHPLRVSLHDLTATSGAGTIAALLEPGATEVRVDVTLRAPGFTFTTPGPAQLMLKPVRDPALEVVVFHVTAHSPGPAPRSRELLAEFWQGNTSLGSVCHHTTVVPANWTGSSVSNGRQTAVGFSIRAPREPCDLRITVQGDDEDGLPPFRMTLTSILPGSEFSDLYVGKLKLDNPGQSLADYLAQIYTAQFNQLPDSRLDDTAYTAAFAAWEQQFNATLDGLGRTLWQWLPEKFREKYLSFNKDGVQVRSILINSDEMILPWELIIPHGTQGGASFELPPLGRSHIIGRWKPGAIAKPQPQRFHVRRFCVVNPPYLPPDDLPSTVREVNELKKLFPKIDVITPADFATVQREVLAREDVHLFHFSGHGDYQSGNADLSTLRLLNGQLNAVTMTGARFLGATNPIIYLNACHAGAAGSVVGRAGGFSANLLNSGSGGVIAPYWPVDDERAADFALGLYEKLRQERSIGEALQELREENPQDLTYRAYAYFGDPWTRLDFSALA